MKHFLQRAAMAAFIFLWGLGLTGCGTVQNVIGGCELPAQYEVVLTGPADLTATDLKTHFEQEAQERHDHKQAVDSFNGLRDYVKTNCQ